MNYYQNRPKESFTSMSETAKARLTTFQGGPAESQGVSNMLESVPNIWTIAACVKQLNCLNHGGGDSDEEGNLIEHHEEEEEEEEECLVESQEEADASEYQEDCADESQDERKLQEAERDGHMCMQQRDDHFAKEAIFGMGLAHLYGVIMLAIFSFYTGADLQEGNLQFRNEKDKEGYKLVILTRNECVVLYSLFVFICLIVTMTYKVKNRIRRT